MEMAFFCRAENLGLESLGVCFTSGRGYARVIISNVISNVDDTLQITSSDVGAVVMGHGSIIKQSREGTETLETL
jgi:hypothetical protein